MAAADITLSSDSAIEIESTAFLYRSGNARINYQVHDVNNSGSGDYTESRRGRATLFIDIEAQRDDTVDIHSNPLMIAADEYVDVKLYPDGTGAVYHSPTFLVNEFTCSTTPSDGGPVTYRFSGQSSGAFTKPGDS